MLLILEKRFVPSFVTFLKPLTASGMQVRSAGVIGKILDWFKSYLTDRQQRVVLPGASSDWTYIRAGVAQGSVLGPLLFLLYINDIVNDIGANIRLFADDTSLFIIVDDPVTAAECLNADLSRISNWADTWLVSFNPTKTESLLISRKLSNPVHPPIYMHNQQINLQKFSFQVTVLGTLILITLKTKLGTGYIL